MFSLVKRSVFVFPKRHYSQPISSFKATDLEIQKTKKPKEKLPNKDLVFGKTFTDHMLSIDYDASSGWSKPLIHPYSKISLDPSASVFHYAMECFEGMKAYKDKHGQVRLFRPDMNMARLQRSSNRFVLPSFDTAQLQKCIEKLVKVDADWIPSERGYSLYIRPTMIATQESLGVAPSAKAKLFVICSPVGPYYKTGFSAVSLLADPSKVRAWPGGVGDYKVGGNYAPSVLTQMEAAKQGFQQNLWLFPNNENQHLITEVGTMNCFVLWQNENGKKQLVTPRLDGSILPGVTRDSIIKLTQDWIKQKKIDIDEVCEKDITIEQVMEASQSGRLHEMFGCGTACIVAPIKKIRFVTGKDKQGNATQYKDIDVPLDPKNPQAQAGPLAKRLSDAIMSIQYGEVEHPWSVVVK